MYLVEIVELEGSEGFRVGRTLNIAKLTSSGLTIPFISVRPLRCFPGPIRIACRLTSLYESIYSQTIVDMNRSSEGRRTPSYRIQLAMEACRPILLLVHRDTEYRL